MCARSGYISTEHYPYNVQRLTAKGTQRANVFLRKGTNHGCGIRRTTHFISEIVPVATVPVRHDVLPCFRVASVFPGYMVHGGTGDGVLFYVSEKQYPHI